MNEAFEIFQMTAAPAGITMSRITTELNQLTHRIMTNTTMVVVLNHYDLRARGVDLQQMNAETQSQKVFPVQRVHKGRKRMKAAEACPPRGDVRANE